MLDPLTGSNTVTVPLPDGRTRELKKCSPSDWLRLSNHFRAFRRALKRSALAGRPQEEVEKALDALDKTPVKSRDVERFLNEPSAQYEAVLFSLAKDHEGGYDRTDRDVLTQEFDDIGLPVWDWLRVAAALFNVPLVPEDGAKKNSSSDPGETASPTGEGTPGGSDTTSPVRETP